MMGALRRCRSDAGGALVELAVALPVVIVVFAATIDFARVFHTATALTDAARAGAQYGASSIIRANDWPGMQSAAQGATNVSGIVAGASTTCQCEDDSGVLVGGSVSCTSTCSGSHMVIMVTVTTSKTFTTVMTGFPSIPSSVSLTRAATMRVHQ